MTDTQPLFTFHNKMCIATGVFAGYLGVVLIHLLEMIFQYQIPTPADFVLPAWLLYALRKDLVRNHENLTRNSIENIGGIVVGWAGTEFLLSQLTSLM